VERVNARVKLSGGADDGHVIGARRFHAMVGIVMLVHLALGTTLARSERGAVKTLGGTRLSPIGRALDEQIDRERSCAETTGAVATTFGIPQYRHGSPRGTCHLGQTTLQAAPPLALCTDRPTVRRVYGTGPQWYHSRAVRFSRIG
jgi:hypothetical protein